MTLKKATAVGNSVVESQPVPREGTPTPDTRTLRSDVVSMYMRSGGEEIEKVQAEAPGTIDFVPNRPGRSVGHHAYRVGTCKGKGAPTGDHIE